MSVRTSLKGTLAAGLLLVTTGVPVASAQSIECGTVVTQSITLDADLECTEGDGLVVGADGLVIDLGGHSVIKQDGAGEGDGVRNEGFDRVTITNGSIEQFRVGVSLTNGADGNEVTHLDLSNRVMGVEVVESDRNTIEDNSLEGAVDGSGIYLEDADHNVIAANLSRAHIVDGVFLTGSDHNLIVGNEVAANFANGVEVTDGSDRNRIIGNEAYNNDSSGITVFGGGEEVEGNVVRDNVVFHNFLGIWVALDSISTRVADNEAFDNSSDGLRIEASGTRVIENLAYENDGWGIRSVEDVFAVRNVAFGNALGDCLNITCDSG